MNYNDSGNGGDIAHNNWPFTLGYSDWGNSLPTFFKGNLDNFEIWDIALTQEVIEGLPPPCDSMRPRWATTST